MWVFFKKSIIIIIIIIIIVAYLSIFLKLFFSGLFFITWVMVFVSPFPKYPWGKYSSL